MILNLSRGFNSTLPIMYFFKKWYTIETERLIDSTIKTKTDRGFGLAAPIARLKTFSFILKI